VENIAATLKELHIGLVAYSPLGRGFLGGGLKPGDLAAADSRRSHPRFQGDNAAVNEDLVAQVAAVASRLDVTPAQVSLAWVQHQSSTLEVPIIPIPGTRRSERVDENLAALDVMLDQPSLDVFESLAGQVAGGRHGALQTLDDGQQEGEK
jgi:aryl-alcohol dehydrogenase-like predicted oxidoreductase